MDTKFSVAIHILILVSEAPKPMNSEQMAGSVGTNASYIRKILALLKRSNILDSRAGRGYKLTAPPDRLSLLQIYQAVMEEPQVHILDVHRNPCDRCVVGRHIGPVLTGMFARLEEDFARSLAGKTLQDCITALQSRMTEGGTCP